MKQGALSLVDVCDELAAFAELAEAVDSLGVVFAFWAEEFHEAVALLAIVRVGNAELTSVEPRALVLEASGISGPGVGCWQSRSCLDFRNR